MNGMTMKKCHTMKMNHYHIKTEDDMNTNKFKQFEFAGSIQRNYEAFLNEAITWHFDGFTSTGGNVSDLSEEEISDDVMNIADNIIRPDYDAIELPDGKVIKREDLEQDIRDQIKEIYH